MYVLVYTQIENNTVAEQRATIFGDWRKASEVMHMQYEEKLYLLNPEWASKYSVSCTIKHDGVTYDWSVLLV